MDLVALDASGAFRALGISLGLGMLVGLQRERVASNVAGIRTFPLITLLGTLCGMGAAYYGPWIVAGGFGGVIAATIVGNMMQLRRGAYEPGITTEIAIILMFAVGAYLPVGHQEVAVAVGAGVAILLWAKKALHRFTRRLGDKDVRAMMQFALITFVILPVLPNKDFGPEPINVVNPHNIWLMVVLVVGISLGGFIAYKFLGKRASTLLGGVFGGMISSTATTVSYAKHLKESEQSNGALWAATLAIVVASLMMYVRVLVEIAVVDKEFFEVAAPPILTMMGVMIVLSLVMWVIARRSEDELPERENPSELKSALLFGLLYAIVLVATALGTTQFGERGAYVVAGISGLTNMHAVTLSTAKLVSAEGAEITYQVGWHAIMLASLTGLLFKCGIAYVLGGRRLFALVSGFFGAAILAGVGILVFWPA